MAAAGRLDPIERWEELHYYGRSFRYRHVSVDEIWALEDEAERRLFVEQGPAFLKMIEAYLDGAERFCGHADPALDDMAAVFAGFLEDLRPTLPSIIALAPLQAARRARRAEPRLSRLLGPPSLATRARAAALQAYNRLRLAGLGPGRPYQPVPQRTVYSRGRVVESAWGGP